MAAGIVPSILLFWRSKLEMFANEEKLNWASVPVMFRLERFNLETVPVVSQEMAAQLQRLLMLVRDQELSEGGEEDKLFLHWMRASACIVDDEVICDGSKERRKRIRRRRESF